MQSVNNVIEFLIKYPSYLNTGRSKIARRLGVSLEVVEEAHQKVLLLLQRFNSLPAEPMMINQVWEGPKGKTTHYKARQELIDQHMLDMLLDSLSNIQLPKIEHIKHIGNSCLVISIPDVHFGKNGETLEEQEFLFFQSVLRLIEESKGHDIDTVILPVGSDFFNTDNSKYTTTKGVPQLDNAVWQVTFIKGSQLIIKTILYLQEKGYTVIVPVVPGNHDWEKSFYLGSVLSTYFDKVKGVIIDNSLEPRKYVKFHNILFGFSHGKYEKVTDLPLLMATEVSDLWSSSLERHIFIGHIHQHEKITIKGVEIHVMPSLSSHGEWEKKMGYIGNGKKALAYIFNDVEGLKGYLQVKFR